MASSSSLDNAICIRWLAQDIWHFWPMAPVIIVNHTLNDVQRDGVCFNLTHTWSYKWNYSYKVQDSRGNLAVEIKV